MYQLKFQFVYTLNWVAVNMHRRISRVGDVQAVCLEINQAALFIYNIHSLHFVKPADLHQGLE